VKNAFVWLPLVYLLIQFIYPFITDVSADVNFEINEESSLLKNIETFLILILCFLILFRSPRFKTKYLGTIPMIVLVFILLFVTATDVWFSFKANIRFLSVLLILPASYVFFLNFKNDKLLYRIILFSSIIAIAYVLISSIYKIGYPYYHYPILYFGGLRLFGLYVFVYAIPIFIIMLSKKMFPRSILIVLIAIMILLLILSGKRAYIIISSIQLIIYFLMFSLRRRYFSMIITVSIALVAIVYSFRSEISNILLVRETAIQRNIQDEGRYKEYVILYQEQILSDDFIDLLLGKDLFNNRGKFGKTADVELNTEERYLHSDFSLLFFSLGLVGFIVYIRIFYLIFMKYRRFRKMADTRNDEMRLFNYGFLVVFISIIINSAIDGYFVFFSRSFAFFLLGFMLARISILNNYYQSLTSNGAVIKT
jgi:hypothetical protein